jgi:hypothetical protein
MKTSLNRIIKALCASAVIAVLSACGGATSTVDPFKPTRVVGLGDEYALATNSVVSQVAADFGQSNIYINSGSVGGKVANLSNQITAVPGGVTSTDLVVISVGTNDLIADATAINAMNPDDLAAYSIAKADVVVAQIQELLRTGKHVLVMPVLDVSRTPWGRAHSFNVDATSTFNAKLLNRLSTNFGGRTPNPVIFGDTNLTPISSQFLFMTATTPTWFSPLNQYDFNSCDPSINCTDNTTSLFDSRAGHSDTYLTAAGMQWAGNLLYAATAQGWR